MDDWLIFNACSQTQEAWDFYLEIFFWSLEALCQRSQVLALLQINDLLGVPQLGLKITNCLSSIYLGVRSLRLWNVRGPPSLTSRSRKLCNFSPKRVDWQTLMQLRQSQRESATGTHCLRLPDISENVYLPNAILASFQKFMTWNYFSGKTE